MISLKIFNRLAFLAILPFMAVTAYAADPLYPLVVHTSKGAEMFQIEMVNTPETMAQGLMHRQTLAADHGMLFVFSEESPVSFWMKNTLIPLDMLFIKQDGRIASIHAMAKPLDESAIPSQGPVSAVLEIAGGEAEKRGIKAGDMVETSFLQGQKQ